MKLSKKLTNVIKVYGDENLLNEFVGKLEKSVNLIPVKNSKRLTSEFINNNWNINKLKLLKSVLFIKDKNESVTIVFTNDEFEVLLLEIIDEMKLDAKYLYVIEISTNSIIVEEIYKNGVLVEENESEYFKNTKYSVARCLAI